MGVRADIFFEDMENENQRIITELQGWGYDVEDLNIYEDEKTITVVITESDGIESSSLIDKSSMTYLHSEFSEELEVDFLNVFKGSN